MAGLRPDLDPIDRVFLPRADIATETLVAGLQEMGWEVDDVTAYRTVRAAPPAAPVRDAIKNGSFDAVLFTSSSTVRNLVGIAGKPHPTTVVACIGPATAKTAEEHGLRVDVLAPEPTAQAPRRRPRRPRPLLALAAQEAGEAVLRRASAAPVGAAAPRERRHRASPVVQPRRAAPHPAIRRLVAETRLHPASSCCRSSSVRASTRPVPISAMPGSCSTPSTPSSRRPGAASRPASADHGLRGATRPRTPAAPALDDPYGILNVALARLVEEVGDDLVVMADLCLDEFTDHGHCGVLAPDGSVDNDATLERYASMALAQAATGAHVLDLSGMMDGQVGRCAPPRRRTGTRTRDPRLRREVHLGPLRPFREAVQSSLVGDRAAYQGPRQRHRGAARARARHRRGRRHRHGQARRAAPRRHRGRRGDVAGSGSAYQISGEYTQIEAAAERAGSTATG